MKCEIISTEGKRVTSCICNLFVIKLMTDMNSVQGDIS